MTRKPSRMRRSVLPLVAALLLLAGRVAHAQVPGICYKKANEWPMQTCDRTMCNNACRQLWLAHVNTPCGTVLLSVPMRMPDSSCQLSPSHWASTATAALMKRLALVPGPQLAACPRAPT